MAFCITYHRSAPHGITILPGIFQSDDPQQTEWITPQGWSVQEAKAAFEARHPGCVVLRCDDIGNPYGNLA